MDPLSATRTLIGRAFVPHVSVLNTDDADELAVKISGRGVLDLLRPLGDRVVGRINARDSQGASLSFDDFAVRFQKWATGQPTQTHSEASSTTSLNIHSQLFDQDDIESRLKNCLRDTPDQLHSEIVRGVLSTFPEASFETFSHPVACLLVVSSSNEDPIDALSELYKQTMEQPSYMSREFVRYYVLLHDEATGDLERSISLFEKMKRHFGVHCNMVRVNKAAEDAGADKVVCTSEWVPELSVTLSEPDEQALRQLVRELTAQSIIPFMERCVATWNDQVASNRRGITSRFFSVSKRYFSQSPSLSTSSLTSPGYSGHYTHSSPEAQIRKLADYAFMMRDYRFAASTYELLRKDFHHDKAWAYLAAAQEMTVISTLLGSGGSSLLRTKDFSVLDSTLDSVAYTYISRSTLPTYALRALLLSSDLLALKSSEATPAGFDSAVRWITKALDERLVGRLGYALLMERASRYESLRHSSNSRRPGARKSAFWLLLAAREWNDSSELNECRLCLDQANEIAYKPLKWTESPTHLFGRLYEATNSLPDLR
ncbi:hypothetical protein TRVA0_007S03004 [Trichomonascus vanleenenianus]|uniref:Trs85p n=1 Tax=Trichomonascus vanleenenianus TaxID=2268995 RepID=UPI003ECAAD9B